MDTPLPPKTKVLYIAGNMRSGSTLLDRLLGQAKGYCSTGELNLIWSQAFVENLLCGCGAHFHNCEFWTAVVTEAYGGWQNIDARQVRDAWLLIGRLRNFAFRDMKYRWSRHQRDQIAEFCEVQEKLYKAASLVSGCHVVVDSSKSPAIALILATIPTIDLYVLHMVRDSRAVAYSMQRKKIKPEVVVSPAYLPQLGPIRSSMIWNSINILSHLLKRMDNRSDRYLRIRYEDLIERPEETLAEIGEYVGETIDNEIFVDRRTVRLGVNHTVAGNPMRFENGPVSIQLDDEWLYKMSARQRRVITALTWPLLKLYGYV